MKNRGAWLAVAASLATVLACGGGNNGSNDSPNGSGNGGGSSGGFPYTGPSCSAGTINEGCWGCLESSCSGSCLTSACNDFFDCFCSCAQGNSSCYQSCEGSISASCQQCVLGIGSCEQSSCASACGSAGSGSGITPPSSGGGSSGGSSSGGGTFQTCGGSGQVCAGGVSEQFCETGFGNMCTAAYYQVGSETFPCASCTDTSGCEQEAQDACGTSVIDAGPPDIGPPDVGPPEDVGPVPDAPFVDGGATCNARSCGTMGQVMTFCEDIDPNGTCTAAWFEVSGEVFDCNSCSDCTTAAQEASSACP